MDGKGKLFYEDGRTYEGEYHKDQKHGWGVYTWNTGKKYEGPWLVGKQHGKGKFTNEKGLEKFGIWENGERKKWVDPEDGTIQTTDNKDNREINQ